MGNDKIFKTTWSFSVWVQTILLGGIVFIFFPWLHISRYAQDFSSQPSSLLILLLGPAIFIIAAHFAPQKYITTDTQIIIHRFGSNIIIPIDKIKSIRNITRKELKTIFRIIGVGGFMGKYGIYRSSEIGNFRMSTTNLSNLILIEYNNSDKIIISPDNPQEFLNSINKE